MESNVNFAHSPEFDRDPEMVDLPDGCPGSSAHGRRRLRGVLRGLMRIVLLWLIISTPFVFLIYRFVEPTYRAESMLLIESNEPQLFGPDLPTEEPAQSRPAYLNSAVATITTNYVINRALAKPGIVKLPMVRTSEDPKAELQEKLDVQIIPNTHWIRVALESTDPRESAAIVNAVVTSYREQSEERGVGSRRYLVSRLEKYLNELDKEIASKRKKVLELARKGDSVSAKASSGHPGDGEDQREVKPPAANRWATKVDEIMAGFLKDELSQLTEMREQVERKLEQMKFTRDKPRISIEDIQLAEVPRATFSNARVRYMVILPLCVLLVVIGASVIPRVAGGFH